MMVLFLVRQRRMPFPFDPHRLCSGWGGGTHLGQNRQERLRKVPPPPPPPPPSPPPPPLPQTVLPRRRGKRWRRSHVGHTRRLRLEASEPCDVVCVSSVAWSFTSPPLTHNLYSHTSILVAANAACVCAIVSLTFTTNFRFNPMFSVGPVTQLSSAPS